MQHKNGSYRPVFEFSVNIFAIYFIGLIETVSPPTSERDSSLVISNALSNGAFVTAERDGPIGTRQIRPSIIL